MQRKRAVLTSSRANTTHTTNANTKNTSSPSTSTYRKSILLLTLIPILMLICTYFASGVAVDSSAATLPLPPTRLIHNTYLGGEHHHEMPTKRESISVCHFPPLLTASNMYKSLSRITHKGQNIRDFINDREQHEDYQMVILYHSSLFGVTASSSYLRHDLGDHICNITDNLTNHVLLNQKVLLTDNRNLESSASAFVFHGPDSHGSSVRRKHEHDIYIYHNMESPAITSVSLTSPEAMKQFDLLMSYQFSSAIFLPYVGRGTIRQLIDTPILVSFEEKSKMGADLAWVGSNCGAHNGRQEYLRELFKYIPTHSYGACLRTEGKSWPHGKSLKDIVQKYKFYIVMENSNCRDYVTEKLGAAIISSTVPVVFSVNGIPNYDHYMPPHSYVNAADFDSAKQLAEYLTYVASNETEYNKYLQYKINAQQSEEQYEEEWQNILKRFQYKETAKHWCESQQKYRFAVRRRRWR